MISIQPAIKGGPPVRMRRARTWRNLAAGALLGTMLLAGMPNANAFAIQWVQKFGSYSTATFAGAGQQQFNWQTCDSNKATQTVQMNLKRHVNNGFDETYSWDNWTCKQGPGGEVGNTTVQNTPNTTGYFLKWNGAGTPWWTSATVTMNP